VPRVRVFPITVLDDDEIDGPQSVDLSATVQGWTTGLAPVQVLDNEALTLTVLLPAGVQEVQGTAQQRRTCAPHGHADE